MGFEKSQDRFKQDISLFVVFDDKIFREHLRNKLI